jgi:hypothetical protein
LTAERKKQELLLLAPTIRRTRALAAAADCVLVGIVSFVSLQRGWRQPHLEDKPDEMDLPTFD